jgi:zinc transporter
MNTTATAYGSDQHGLIWAYRFEPDHAAVELDAAAALQWLADAARRLHEPNSFLWLHFSLANASAVRWMQAQLQLPQAFYDSLHEVVPSTRLEQEEASLVAVIHDVLYEGEFDSSSVSSVSACLGPQLLVSARLRPLRSVERLRETLRGGAGFRSSAELLAQLMREQANVLVDIVRRSTSRVDVIEDSLLTGRVAGSRHELSAMRRALVRLRRLLAPEPAALFRLLNRPPAWLREADLQDLRQAGEEFTTAVADSVELAERVRLLQEELSAAVDEQTNRTLFILTLVTVLALPINLVAGLLGMNVGGMPLSTHHHGFLIVVVILSVITALLAHLLRLFRNRS